MDDFNIDVQQIENKITPKTKAIVPVHLYGQCADMESILKIATKHNLYIIEDAAQSLGAVYTFSNRTKKKSGTMGTIGTTSFFPSKNLGCFGDGGAIFTNDEQLGERIRMMANHGQRIKYYHDLIGVNSRLDTLQAAILLVKLKYLHEYESKRNEVASFYDNALKNIPQIKTPSRIKNSTHVFHQYTLQVDRRDELKKYLEEKGVPTMIYYPVPLHLQKAYSREGFGEGSFPVTEKLSKVVISIPIHTEMKTEELEFIVSKIKSFYSK
jgi:dTDP-4-amino-4,6-dideoxygalactose transaminase